MFFQILGYIAACFTTISFLPQALKTIKTRDTTGISFWMYAVFSTGVFLWIIYGLYLNDPAIYLANMITFLFAVVILAFKIKNITKGEKF